MPIEIREIVIRATVNQGDAATSSPGSGNAAAPPGPSGPDVLQECLDQITQIMQDKKER
jgi:hypothetical protein